jgi:hypothetical protein
LQTFSILDSLGFSLQKLQDDPDKFIFQNDGYSVIRIQRKKSYKIGEVISQIINITLDCGVNNGIRAVKNELNKVLCGNFNNASLRKLPEEHLLNFLEDGVMEIRTKEKISY